MSLGGDRASFVYWERVMQLLRQLAASQQDAIEAAAELVVDAWENGGRLLVATTTHGLHDEAIERAGGPFGIDVLEEVAFDWSLPPDVAPVLFNDRDIAALPNATALDAVLVPTNCGTTKRTVGIALVAKEMGARCIAMTSLAFETSPAVQVSHASGKRLHEVADVTIDLGGEPGDAVVVIPGASAKAAPTSLVTAAVALWMMLARACEKVAAHGHVPYLMESVQLGWSAQESNLAQYRRWKETGYPFDRVGGIAKAAANSASLGGKGD